MHTDLLHFLIFSSPDALTHITLTSFIMFQSMSLFHDGPDLPTSLTQQGTLSNYIGTFKHSLLYMASVLGLQVGSRVAFSPPSFQPMLYCKHNSLIKQCASFLPLGFIQLDSVLDKAVVNRCTCSTELEETVPTINIIR